MAYSDFTLEGACRSFALSLQQVPDLHGEAAEVPVSPFLAAILEQFVPLATSIHTEKARSEFIIAPILAEIRSLSDRRVSLFSGIDFTVATDQGLSGFCDYLLADSPNQLYLEAPVVAVVEAKNENIKGGLGQCVAEMVAARIYNAEGGRGPTTVLHGAVTTGSIWRFLKLDGSAVLVDTTEYYLDRLGKILGILLDCVGRGAAAVGH